MRIRFLRGRARARSPAAERIFARRTRIDTAGAGAPSTPASRRAGGRRLSRRSGDQRRHGARIGASCTLMRRPGAVLGGTRRACPDAPTRTASWHRPCWRC
ncbi:hypothetical protein SR39_17285 [Methylobacterium radiotolerans]|nr:hypothetical protein SR39_17285 [Methylobacterium radiotolerans]